MLATIFHKIWHFEKKMQKMQKRHSSLNWINQLTRFKTNLCLSYKTNMENIKHSFSKYFILIRGQEVRDCEDWDLYSQFSIVTGLSLKKTLHVFAVCQSNILLLCDSKLHNIILRLVISMKLSIDKKIMTRI